MVGEAKLQKQAVARYKATMKLPEINADVRWGMSRFMNSGQVSVTCHGFRENLNSDWYGAPVFISGIVFCLRARIKTSTDDGPPVRYLAVHLCCQSDLHSQGVTAHYKFELVHCNFSNKNSVFSGGITYTFHKKGNIWGYSQFRKLTDVLANHYDVDNDSCTIVAHVSSVDVKPTNQNE